MEKKPIDRTKLLTILVSITLVISVINLSATLNLHEGAGVARPGTIQQPTPQAPSGPPPKIEVSADDDPVKGDKNAPVTIIEFSDFQCPFCGRFFTETLGQIQKNYIDTGKVKLVYRDLPLSFHPEAEPTAIAAECADEQGKFWEFRDVVFTNQDVLSDAMRSRWAEDIGLDINKFKSCLADPKTKKEVQADNADATKYGASGTPTFFVNGIRLVGAQPYAAFEKLIEEELAK